MFKNIINVAKANKKVIIKTLLLAGGAVLTGILIGLAADAKKKSDDDNTIEIDFSTNENEDTDENTETEE